MADARLFFALWPSDEMQRALAGAVTAIVRGDLGREARAVPAGNFHLTLAFLGAVPVGRVEDVKRAAGVCVREVREGEWPIDVVLDTVEYWRKPRVLCATAREAPRAAVALADALKRALIAEGFAPDLKPFRVHATLARKVLRVTGDLAFAPVRWRFADFHLVESRTGAEGSAYSTVEKWVLDKNDR